MHLYVLQDPDNNHVLDLSIKPDSDVERAATESPSSHSVLDSGKGTTPSSILHVITL